MGRGFAQAAGVGPGNHSRLLVSLALLTVVIWGVANASPFLVPLCFSGLIAFLMTPLVRRLRRWRVPEWAAITLAALILILPIAGVIYLVVAQGQSMIGDFPSIMASVRQAFGKFANTSIGQKLDLGSTDLSNLGARLSSSAGKGLTIVIGGLAAFISASSQLALILLIAILMIASRAHLRRCAENIVAQSESIEAAALLDAVTATIQRFLIARLFIVLIVGTLTFIALQVLNVPYSFLLAGWNGIMTLLPAVGFIFGVIPTLLVVLAVGKSAITAVFVFGVYLSLNILDGNILTPKMVGKRLNLNALTTFIGLLGGGLLWGVWGMFLSIPILGVIRITFSAIPELQPWGDLMAEREDRKLAYSLIRKKHERREAA